MTLERAVALSNEWNIAYLTPIALAGVGHVYARSGRVEEGVSWLKQALTGYASAGIGYLRSLSMMLAHNGACAEREVLGTACGDERGALLARPGHAGESEGCSGSSMRLVH
jgi:hypothetical protein